MKAKILFASLVTVAASLLLSGCVVALGNRVPPEDKAAAQKGTPTLGKQLTDLKQARDSGALTEDEYQSAKKRLLEPKSLQAH